MLAADVYRVCVARALLETRRIAASHFRPPDVHTLSYHFTSQVQQLRLPSDSHSLIDSGSLNLCSIPGSSPPNRSPTGCTQSNDSHISSRKHTTIQSATMAPTKQELSLLINPLVPESVQHNNRVWTPTSHTPNTSSSQPTRGQISIRDLYSPHNRPLTKLL